MAWRDYAVDEQAVAEAMIVRVRRSLERLELDPASAVLVAAWHGHGAAGPDELESGPCGDVA
jgi:hypothetical protein